MKYFRYKIVDAISYLKKFRKENAGTIEEADIQETKSIVNLINKMTSRKLSFLILILIALTSCNKNPQSEEKIISDIFPQLIDSLHIKWNPLPLPPPQPIFDKDSKLVGVDSINMKQIITEHQKYLDRLDSIDSRTLIVITDTCFIINCDDLTSITYSNDDLVCKLIILNESKKNVSQQLNPDKINIPNDFKLIKKEDSNIWTTLRNRKFAGLLEFSKIYQLENNDFGLLQVNYYYNELNGYSYFIIIEKFEGKWQINKLFRNWET